MVSFSSPTRTLAAYVFPLAACFFLITLSVLVLSHVSSFSGRQSEDIFARDVYALHASLAAPTTIPREWQSPTDTLSSQTQSPPPINPPASQPSPVHLAASQPSPSDSNLTPLVLSLAHSPCMRFDITSIPSLPARNATGNTTTVAIDWSTHSVTLKCGDALVEAKLIAPILLGKTKRLTRIIVTVPSQTGKREREMEALLVSTQSGFSSLLICASLHYTLKLPELLTSSSLFSAPRLLYACDSQQRPWYIVEYVPGWNLHSLSQTYVFSNELRCSAARGILAYVRTLRDAGDSDCDLHLGNFMPTNITEDNMQSKGPSKLMAFDFDCVGPSRAVATMHCCMPRISNMINSSCFSAIPESPADDDCRAVSILQKLFMSAPSATLRDAISRVPLRNTTLNALSAIVDKACV